MHNSENSQRDLLIAFSLLPFLTPARRGKLLCAFQPPGAITSAPSDLVGALLRLDPEQAAQLRDPFADERLRRRVESLRDELIVLGDPDYSPMLREIHDPPFALYAAGNRSLLSSPSIAIVGSRNASAYGISTAEHIARQLAAAGITVVSGLARGVDAAAHLAALSEGGNTIAVLGTGIDIVYPRGHQGLFKDISSKGLVTTEFGKGTNARPENFPVRNRIIAGLCAGTIVVEASSRSGSLITARIAAEEGREVFAVPGSVRSSGSDGPHRLIQSGAKLLHDIEDLFEELPNLLRRDDPSSRKPPSRIPSDPKMSELLGFIPFEGTLHVDDVRRTSNWCHGDLAEGLLLLEMDGYINAMPGSRYQRKER